mmetsp:Transcript_764/g.1608  ORF Transcript_764/g.1608 Transcript_764/m.1608 type:complete len:373 (+) Transcript_764:1947-3065(+)
MQVQRRGAKSTDEGLNWMSRILKTTRSWYRHPGFQLFSDFGHFANALFLVVLYQMLPPDAGSLHIIVVSVFIVFPFIELSIALASWGVGGLLVNFSLQFLLIATDLVSRSICLILLLRTGQPNFTWLIPSIFRFMFLAFRLSSGKLIFAVLVGVGEDLIQIVTSMICFAYLYASIGYWTFGGRLYRLNPALNQTSYSTLSYFQNNFNSLQRSMVVLFQFTFLNDWPATMSGVMAVSSNVAGIYFLVWFLIVVAVLLNVFMSAITRPYVILNADIGTVSSSCRQFGVGEEVIKTFLWKEADFLDENDSVWTRKLSHLGKVQASLTDLDDDPQIQMVMATCEAAAEQVKSVAKAANGCLHQTWVPKNRQFADQV